MTEGNNRIINLFKIGAENLVLDSNSGALYRLSEPAYEILSKLLDLRLELTDENTENILKKELSNIWSEGIIEHALAELKDLVERGQLFTKEINIYNMDSEATVKALCLNLAHTCNMSCKYCFAEGGTFGKDYEKNNDVLMDVETSKKAVDFLFSQVSERKNCEIDFFGGEPLLNWKVLKETVFYAREKAMENGKNVKFTLTTNGLLLDQDKIKFLNDYEFAVVLSLDGRKSVHDSNRKDFRYKGTYDQIVPFYQRLVEERNHEEYFIRGTYTVDNIDFSNDVAHIASLGFKEISLEPVIASKDNYYSLENVDFKEIEEEYKRLAFLYEDKAKEGKGFSFYHFEVDLEGGPCLKKRYSGCGAGLEYLAITPSGEIYPCHQFVSFEDFKMGNVHKGFSIDEDVKKKFKNNSFLYKNECYNCWAKFFCGGGCHANAYLLNGSIENPYELGCKLEKTRLECALYLASKGVLQRYNSGR